MKTHSPTVETVGYQNKCIIMKMKSLNKEEMLFYEMYLIHN